MKRILSILLVFMTAVLLSGPSHIDSNPAALIEASFGFYQTSAGSWSEATSEETLAFIRVSIPVGSNDSFWLANTFAPESTGEIIWEIPSGHRNVYCSENYRIERPSEGNGSLMTIKVAESGKSITAYAEYSFHDLAARTQPIGHRSTGITGSVTLTDIASRFKTVDDVADWMHKNLSYQEGLDGGSGVRTDIQTLNDGGGDCDELCILFISLLEKMPQPIWANIVTGYETRTLLEQGFGAVGHTVVEVYGDGIWTNVDPTWIVVNGMAAPDEAFVPINWYNLEARQTNWLGIRYVSVASSPEFFA